MKIVALTLVANISSAICIISAAMLAYHDRGAWAWFLIAGALLHASVEWKSGDGR